MKTIALTNQKGGVAKSTTAHALMDGLTARGYKVLGIDLDGQCNLTIANGINPKAKGLTVLGVLAEEIDITQAIRHTNTEADIVPASNKLVSLMLDNATILRDALKPIQDKYDFCIIDTPPALSLLTANALVSSDAVVIPAKADLYSLQGIDDLTDTILGVQQKVNPGLKVAGILLTAYKQRTTLHKEMLQPMQQLADNLGTSLFNTTIRDAVLVSEAPLKQQSILTYAPKSTVAQDYNNFIDELLERI